MYKEIIKCFKTASGADEIENIRDRIQQIMPSVQTMFGYDQKNSSHQYDLWGHCVHTVLNLPRNLDDDMLYLAALLHDIGKPDCQCDGRRPDDKNKHYYGHPERSKEIVKEEVLPGLEKAGVLLSGEEKQRLLYYVEYHDDRVSLRLKHLRRHMKMVTMDEFQNLMLLQIADAKAHVLIPVVKERIEVCSQWAGEYAWQMYSKL